MSTIAAIATPNAAGGIGIIRISGENALDIMKEVFDGYNKFMVEHDKADQVYENLDDMFHYEEYIED